MTITDRTIGRHNVDDLQFVTATEFPVVGIMRWCDFQESACKLRLCVLRITTKRNGHDYIIVFDDWNDSIDDRQSHTLAAKCSGARITRIDSDSTVTQHRLRTSRCNSDVTRAIFEWILQIPKESIHFFHFDFIVGERSLGSRIPIHQSFAALNQTVGEEAEE